MRLRYFFDDDNADECLYICWYDADKAYDPNGMPTEDWDDPNYNINNELGLPFAWEHPDTQYEIYLPGMYEEDYYGKYCEINNNAIIIEKN